MAGWHHQCNGQELQEMVRDKEAWSSLCAAVHVVAKKHNWATEQQL